MILRRPFQLSFGLACSSDSSQFKFSVAKDKSYPFFHFTNSLHILISSSPSSIPSTHTPDLHFKGPSLSFFNFKTASHPVFQTGKAFLKHLQNYSLTLVKSPLCHVATTQLDFAFSSWQAPCLPLLQKSISVLSFYTHLRLLIATSHLLPSNPHRCHGTRCVSAAMCLYRTQDKDCPPPSLPRTILMESKHCELKYHWYLSVRIECMKLERWNWTKNPVFFPVRNMRIT